MKSFFTTILLVVVLIPTSVFAEEAANNFLVGIPGVGDPTGDFDGYINAIYAMFISLAALLAVVKIVIAGVKYMFTDIVPQKTQAKQDIQGALFGLLIVLGAVLILTVINPDLTNFNLDTDMIERPDRNNDRNVNEELSDREIAVRENEVRRNCVKIGCADEIFLCKNGGFFESDPTRLGADRIYTRGNNNTISCTPEENTIEILARLNQERLESTASICNDNSLYTWDSGSNRCTTLEQTLEVITLEDILDFNTLQPEYLEIQALLAEEFGIDYIEDNLQDFIDGAIPVSFNICNVLDGGSGTYTSINNLRCQSSTSVSSATEAPEAYQFKPVTSI